jgi:hypothetical protein
MRIPLDLYTLLDGLVMIPQSVAHIEIGSIEIFTKYLFLSNFMGLTLCNKNKKFAMKLLKKLSRGQRLYEIQARGA